MGVYFLERSYEDIECRNKVNVSCRLLHSSLSMLLIELCCKWVYESETSHACPPGKYSLLCWRELFGIVLISNEKFNLTYGGH